MRRGLRVGAEASGRLLQYELMSRAPKKTGRFASSIRSRVRAKGLGYEVTFTAADPPARFILEGTRPHEIVPRNGRALRFEAGGSVVFATHVNHPGTKPNRFAVETGRREGPVVYSIFQAAVMSALGL